MGADAAAFAALSERVAELERRLEAMAEQVRRHIAEQQEVAARLYDEVFGKDIHEAVLGEVKPPEPRLDQPKRTR